MVVRHPGMLAEETRWRVSRRDAVRFYWVSVVLATLIGTGMFAAAFAFRGRWWAGLAPEQGGHLFGTYVPWPYQPIAAPMFVLWDSWLTLIPVAISLLTGNLLSTSMFRWLVGTGEGDKLTQRRTRRVGFYHSGLGVWLVLLLGVWGISEAILQEAPDWLGKFLDGWLETSLLILRWIVPLVAGILFLFSTAVFLVRAQERPVRFLKLRMYLLVVSGLAFVPFCAEEIARNNDYSWSESLWGEVTNAGTAVTGLAALVAAVMAFWCLVSKRKRAQIARAWTVVLTFPAVLIIIWPVIAVVAFWVCGYLAIGVASMLRR